MIATLSNFGMVYFSEGKCDEAIEYFKKGLEIEEQLRGSDSITSPLIYGNIASAYHHKQDLSNALKYYKRTYEIICKHYGAEHPQAQSVKFLIDDLQSK